MRKLIFGTVAALLIGAALTITPPTFAGAGKAGVKGERHAGKRLQKVAQTLDLTDAQKAQIKPILRSAAQQVKALRQDTSLTPEQQKAKRKAIRQDTLTQIAAILTPTQKAKLAAMRHKGHKGARA